MRSIVLSAALMLLPVAAFGQSATGNASQTVGTTAVTLFSAGSRGALYLENAAAGNSGPVCYWSDLAGVTPGVNVPGSRLLSPGTSVSFGVAPLNTGALPPIEAQAVRQSLTNRVPSGPITMACSGATGITAEAN